MHDILKTLPPGSTVLDLGSGAGSFRAEAFLLTIVRADLETPATPPRNFVVCSASSLPFPDRSFRALILNHSLEHFQDLAESLREIARVLATGASIYIAVPDASTFTDRVYRWLGRGGGHVNLFTDPAVICDTITAATGLRWAGTRVLHTSLSFLNRRNIASRAPRKLVLYGYGHEGFLRLLNYVLRRLDRRLGWRTSVYGWAFYFGETLQPQLAARSNVCVRCGSGHPAELLIRTGRVVRRRLLPAAYTCPQCEARNLFTADYDPQK